MMSNKSLPTAFKVFTFQVDGGGDDGEYGGDGGDIGGDDGNDVEQVPLHRLQSLHIPDCSFSYLYLIILT